MVRSEIISKLSNKIDHKLKKSELIKILDIFFNVIVNGIKDKRSVELRNFGRFSLKVIKENKNARNPLTGKKITVKEKKSIYFKMSKELRKKINENRVLN